MGIDASSVKPADFPRVSGLINEATKRDASFSLGRLQAPATGNLEYPALTKLVIIGEW